MLKYIIAFITLIRVIERIKLITLMELIVLMKSITLLHLLHLDETGTPQLVHRPHKFCNIDDSDHINQFHYLDQKFHIDELNQITD